MFSTQLNQQELTLPVKPHYHHFSAARPDSLVVRFGREWRLVESGGELFEKFWKMITAVANYQERSFSLQLVERGRGCSPRIKATGRGQPKPQLYPFKIIREDLKSCSLKSSRRYQLQTSLLASAADYRETFEMALHSDPAYFEANPFSRMQERPENSLKHFAYITKCFLYAVKCLQLSDLNLFSEEAAEDLELMAKDLAEFRMVHRTLLMRALEGSLENLRFWRRLERRCEKFFTYYKEVLDVSESDAAFTGADSL